jgi:hypothetical protein
MDWWKFMTAKWQKLRHLSWRQRWILVQSLALLPLIALGMRLLGFKRIQTLVSSFVTAARPGIEDQAAVISRARGVAKLVGAAARNGLYRATCLPQSLTLWWLLRRRGIDSQLRIGVRKVAGELEAHAWVEFQGQVINDGADVHQRFAAFGCSVIPS